MTYTQQRAHGIGGEFSCDELLKLIAALRLIHAGRLRASRRSIRSPEPLPVATRGPNTRITIIDGNGVQSCKRS